MTFAYSVTLTDPSDLGGAADPLMVTDLGAALSDWSKYITGLGTLAVNLVVINTQVGRADGGPTAVVADGTAAGGALLEEPSSMYELLTGQHAPGTTSNGTTSDITIEVDPVYIAQLFLNPDPGNGAQVPGDEIDAVSVFRHELDHGFGMSGYYNDDGTLAYGGAYLSLYDQFIRMHPDGAADFTGPTAEAVYGGPVPLTTDSTTENYYHLANNANGPLGQDLMNGQYFYYGATYQISNVDLAILKDTGVPVTSGVDGPLACFVAGTRIRTVNGGTAVEALREGDLVETIAAGTMNLRPIVWIGERRIDVRTHPRPNKASPIRIRANAFGDGLPARDLLVSPDHVILADGVLVPAKLLVNEATILRDTNVSMIHYVHVELDRHAILLAEGLPAESYRDTGNRAMFANAGIALIAHPDFALGERTIGDACMPLALHPSQVGPIWERLARRADALGYPRFAPVTTSTPDLRIRVGGRELGPVAAARRRYVFALPHCGGPLRLFSRAGAPSDARPWLADDRRLGVAVERIVLRGDEAMDVLAPDHPALLQGWWPAERDGTQLWRWTTGEASIPDRCPGGEVARVIEIALAADMLYRLPEADTDTRQAA